MSKWRNDAGDELTVPVHMLLDCTTLQDERRQWCIGGLAWVSVAERAPPPDTAVLAAAPGWREPFITTWTGAVWVVESDREIGAALEHPDDVPTHWMPLPPAPPKE